MNYFSEGLHQETSLIRERERPRQVQVFSLPEITVNGRKIRLGMHTDTIINFIKFLRSSPKAVDLEIEVRKISSDQYERLQKNPLYRFYLSSRIQRVRFNEIDEEVIGLVFPGNIGFSLRDAIDQIKKPFTPRSLADDYGFKSTWLTSRYLIGLSETQTPNALLPLLGGCNEFYIGSNSLKPEELKELASEMQKYLFESDLDITRLLPQIKNVLSNLLPQSSILNNPPETKIFPLSHGLKNLNITYNPYSPLDKIYKYKF